MAAVQANGTVNLNGGTFETNFIDGTTKATVNFNGGLLKAAVDNGNFINSSVVSKISAGGANIDTDFNVQINSAVDRESLVHGRRSNEDRYRKPHLEQDQHLYRRDRSQRRSFDTSVDRHFGDEENYRPSRLDD